ncbi:MAG: hypothetical protein KDI36_11630 [Pseudomonadales bacterium]|nr:hypothetical protein [Pseudomonadales bacterium]
MENLAYWFGWCCSLAVSAIFLVGAKVQFSWDSVVHAASSVPQLPDWTHKPTAVSLVVAALLHLLPYPAFATLGAIIMTGMLGGMIGTLLLQDNAMWWTRAIMGLLPWLGLYLRCADFNNLMSFWR